LPRCDGAAAASGNRDRSRHRARLVRAYFESMAVKLADAATAERAWINEHCVPWPCKRTDETACPNPDCEWLCVKADEALAVALGQIPAMRAQVRIATSP
jgi:hypothetical protein